MYCELGRIASDIELRGNEDNKVARFSLAVPRQLKREGQPEADFVHCVAFGRYAEILERYVSKGQQLYVIGRLENDFYFDRDGNKKDDWVIKIDGFKFVDSKNSKKIMDFPCPF